ncbi:MAG: ATP-binding protein [Caldilineaceae bacterium]
MLAETIVSAMTEAIVGHLIEQSDLIEKGSRILKQPSRVQVAISTVIAQAYTQFLKSEHRWAASALFDEHFVREHVAPLIYRFLERDQRPDPSELVNAWVDQFTMRGETRESNIMKLQPVATDFLELVWSGLRANHDLRTIFDSKDLVAIAQHLDNIADTTSQMQASFASMTRDMQRAMEEAKQQYYDIYIDQATGTAIGDQAMVVNLTVNGPILFDQFENAQDRLQTQIRSAKTYIAKRTEDFVGRGFVFSKIDEILNQREQFPSGYLVISGEPGIGKTALCGELIKRLGCVYHFNIANQGVTSPQAFLKNICAQLIVRYNLHQKYAFAFESTQRFDDSGFFMERLEEVASKRVDEPIVMVVDALDEAEQIHGLRRANPLFLPEALPDGVYCIVSRRSIFNEDDPLQVERRYNIEIDKNDPRNLKDVHDYIQNFLSKNRSVMLPKIEEWRISADKFTGTIYERSEGNFMYARSVLTDIYQGTLNYQNLDSIQHLPKGLREYYRRHRDLMRQQDPLFDDLVCVLAAFDSPLSVPEASAMISADEFKVRRSFEHWRSFLSVMVDADGVTRYSLYHRSFQEYLDEVEGCADRWRGKMQTDLEAFLNSSL